MSTEKKPFHESIVDAIENCFPNDLNTLANLLMVTRIPKNHEAIIVAWEERTRGIFFVNKGKVVEAVLEEKRLAEEKNKDKKEISLES